MLHTVPHTKLVQQCSSSKARRFMETHVSSMCSQRGMGHILQLPLSQEVSVVEKVRAAEEVRVVEEA